MLQKNIKTIGIILFLLGVDGLIAVFLRLHLVPYPLVSIILIIIGAYLIFKLDDENNNE